MTIVALWYEPFDDAVWSISDTRISKDSSGNTTLTDGAAKILPLTIHCRRPPPGGGFFDQTSYLGTAGFAYAGSTLSAVMSYTVANACCQNLIRPNEGPPPSIGEIANLVGRIAQKYMREILDRNNGQEGNFSAFIFGWCPREMNFRAFDVEPSIAGGSFSVSATEVPVVNRDWVGLLGNDTQKVRDAIDQVRNEKTSHGIGPTRWPKRALEQIIASQSIPGVGGSLQIGLASRAGFQLFASVRSLEQDRSQAQRTFLGFNIDSEVGLVGNYMIGINGMT